MFQETHAGFCGLNAQQYYTTLVNAFAQPGKSGAQALLFFRSLPVNLPSISFAPLTSPFICALLSWCSCRTLCWLAF
jgi:hypothetical protein